VVEEVEVLEQRGLGIDGEREHLAVVQAQRDPPLAVRQRCDVEQRRDPLPSLDLAEQNLASLSGQGDCQGAGNGGLAGSALPRDHVQTW
jgi:hypothetical protein